jgi:hypothetical protein
MPFKLLGEYLTPADREDTVRTYHCTSLISRLLGVQAEGYLTVTNKRVVFYAYGSSYAGKSVLHNEVPIADVSGLSTYKGTYFSIGHFLAAVIVSVVAGNFITAIVGVLVGAIVAALFRETPDVDIAQVVSVVLSALGVIAALVSRSYARDRLLRPIFATTGGFLLAASGTIGFAIGSLARLQGREGGFGTLLLIGAFVVGIYAFITYFWYARREGMSLTIGSKGGASTPIAIAGISVFGLFNTAALKALTAEPAPDAEAMIKELGAVISDIQAMGDLGVQKWASVPEGSA